MDLYVKRHAVCIACSALPDRVASSTLTVWGLLCRCLWTQEGLLGLGLGKYFRLGAGGVANTERPNRPLIFRTGCRQKTESRLPFSVQRKINSVGLLIKLLPLSLSVNCVWCSNMTIFSRSHLNGDKIESDLSVPWIQGCVWVPWDCPQQELRNESPLDMSV